MPGPMDRKPYTADQLTDWMGVRWDDAQTVRVTVRPELLNPVGLLSGVVAFTLIDYSMASTLVEHLREGENCATLNIAITYLRGAREGELICRSQLDRRTRTNAALRSEVTNDAGEIVATANGTYAIFPARRS